METGLGQMRSRGLHALAVCMLSVMVWVVPQPVASVGMPKARVAGLIGVQFSDDCVSVVVESSREVTSIVAVFNNDAWEQMDGLPGVLSYVVKVGPNASESGLAIATLYVDASSRLQKEPLGIVPHKVGLTFECEPKTKRITGRL